jgi:hypothetical protein
MATGRAAQSAAKRLVAVCRLEDVKTTSEWVENP